MGPDKTETKFERVDMIGLNNLPGDFSNYHFCIVGIVILVLCFALYKDKVAVGALKR